MNVGGGIGSLGDLDSDTDLTLNGYNLTHKISGFFNYQWSEGELVHPLTVQFSVTIS